jgi:ring-1,2-phenylacetyl-CoA epoxidase subunit PaaC
MQSALNECWNYALGIFEKGDFEKELAESGVFEGEAALQARWLAKITPIIEKAGLRIPAESSWEPVYGGRKAYHSDYLAPLVEEMSEVFRVDPSAEW